MKAWRGLAALGFVLVQQNGALGGATGLAAVVAIAAGMLYGWLAWRVTRFRLDGPDVVIETGIAMKRSRRVPLARLQAVDVVRPLVARLLGLAELRLEVAGGDRSHVSLAYLSEDDAQAVRNDLLSLAAGLRDGVAVVEAPPEAAEAVIAEVPVGLQLAATIVSWPLLSLLAGVTVTVIVSATAGPTAGAAFLGSLVPLALGIGAQTWASFHRDFGTVVAIAADGLRIRRGLLDTRSQTVPPGRVQGLVVRQPAPWRPFGWTRLLATVAGYGAGEAGSRSTTLLPVAPHAMAAAVIHHITPEMPWPPPPLDRAPRRARFRAPVERQRLQAGFVGPDRLTLVTIRGRLGRRSDIVPLERAQSARVTQGPIQRLLSLATVHVDLPPGPVRGRALHRDAAEARALCDAIAVGARRARGQALPDRWMRSPG